MFNLNFKGVFELISKCDPVDPDEPFRIVLKLEMELPQKKNYRQRAHSNPIADHQFD